MRKKLFIFTILTFLFSSLDTFTFACGNQSNYDKKDSNTEKSCCSSKNSNDKKGCCCSNPEKDTKETKKCDGSCKHNSCSPTTNTGFYLESNDILPITTFHFEEEVPNMWAYSQLKIHPVYLSIWQPPKI